MTPEEKEHALAFCFKNKRNILIAFSGGADSALLASAAAAASGDKALAVTVKTELVSEKETENARKTAAEIGIKHIIIEKNILRIPEINRNRRNRCYACKKEMLTTLLEYAAENGFEAVAEGTNESDWRLNEREIIPRPGFTFITEQKKRQKAPGYRGPVLMTPLADLGITKEDVRILGKRRNLSAAGKPSMSCLATRLPYDTELTPNILKTIDVAEDMLSEIGADQIRIRCHADDAGRKIARIELGKDEIGLLFKAESREKTEQMITFLKQNGFAYATVDLEGFRSGSMDI